MKNRIITISRQFGSGGRTIGKEVAQKLGIPCYDHELIEEAAKKSGLAKEFIADQGEYTPYGSWFINALNPRTMDGLSTQDYLWTVQRKIILELGEKGPCVIVGRCADSILEDRADLIKVFIHSDMKTRAERIVNLYGETDVSPEKRLKNKDKCRKAYYHFYTDTEWGNAENYHVSLDSGKLGIDKCVDIIVDLYK